MISVSSFWEGYQRPRSLFVFFATKRKLQITNIKKCMLLLLFRNNTGFCHGASACSCIVP